MINYINENSEFQSENYDEVPMGYGGLINKARASPQEVVNLNKF